MNSETKIIGTIGVITILVIAGGLYFASKSNLAGSNSLPEVTVKADALVRADSPRLTGKNAGETAVNPNKIQIVEFGDLECPACAVLNPELKKLIASDPDNIDFVVRFIPIHQNSKKSAAAALAAGEQGKFFEMYDLIFENQAEWAKYGADYDKLFDSYAEKVGLNMTKYRADLKANFEKYSALVDRDSADATAMKVNSTPTLIINGKVVVRGAYPFEKLKEIVSSVLTATSTSNK